jgi:hypothetical protein
VTRSPYLYPAPLFPVLVPRSLRSLGTVRRRACGIPARVEDRPGECQCHLSAIRVPMAQCRAECHECHTPVRGDTTHDGWHSLMAPRLAGAPLGNEPFGLAPGFPGSSDACAVQTSAEVRLALRFDRT